MDENIRLYNITCFSFMKRHTLYLFSWLLLLSITSLKAQIVNYDDLERRDHIAYLKGESKPFTGKAKALHKNGTVKQEITFVNGVKEGAYMTWYASGKKESIKYYKDNKLEGAVITWYENGSYERKVEFLNNKKHGKFESFYENGQLKETGAYVNGKKTGVGVGYYENGQKESEGNWVDDAEDGLHTSWFKTGKKSSEIRYKNGQQVDAKYWAEDGHLMSADEVQKMLKDLQNRNLMQVWQNQQSGD